MKKRKLGKNGPVVSAIGLGCMGMSEFYGKSDDKTSSEIIMAALDLGITMLDTADMYGSGHNEELIGRTLNNYSGELFIATKCGIQRKPGEYARTINNSPEYIRTSVENSLKRLRRETIDLFYLHRVNREIPLAESIGTLADLVKEGKIRYIGLSEVSVSTLEEANDVYPVTAVQTEYSLTTRDAEKELLPFLEKTGTGFVPYSPLGRGLLTAKLDKTAVSAEGDLRKFLPRTGEIFFEENMKTVNLLQKHAEQAGYTPAQIALAWILSRNDSYVPIPGTRHNKYLIENCKAVEIRLSEETKAFLERLFTQGSIHGERYTEEGMKGLNS
ncbi:MAG: aldo/keto reductase [Spirochaetes bacterium]|nr:aldo/keto reductase [Spirochaetota bacterium]